MDSIEKALETEKQIITREYFKKQQNNPAGLNTKNAKISELIEKETYLNGVPIFLNQNEFDLSIIEWLSNVAAVDLISTKNIDVFVSDENWNLDESKSFEFDNLLKSNYLEQKIFDIAKKTSISGISGIWFMPVFQKGLNKKYSLNSNINIVQYKTVNNEPQAVKFLVNLVKGIAIGNVYALVYCNKTEYRTQYYAIGSELDNDKFDWKDENKLKEYEISELDLDKYLESFRFSKDLIPLLNQEHNLGFLPFFTLFFNENYTPLIDLPLLRQDFNELFTIAQKIYDEANMMGTKIKWLNDGDINSLAQRSDLMVMLKVLGSLAGVFCKGDFNSDQNNADVDIVTKTPVYIELSNSFKTKLNFILKKIGLSSDTDSKGTVQQSIGEIIRQNEFSYNNQNYRNIILQNFLQNMLEKFFIANFTGSENYKIKVLSTQSLGMSEMEKLNYVIMAKSNGLIDQARGISILTGKNYIDSLALMKIQKLKDVQQTNEQPNLFKQNNVGSQND